MSIVRLEIANPVAESVIPRIEPAPRPADLADLTIGLYWNFKPGGNVGLDQVAVRLRERYPDARFVNYEGAVGASVRHVTPAQADEIARECDVVVGTTGD
jgi:hypothetical protein